MLDLNSKSLYMFKCQTNKWNRDFLRYGSVCGPNFMAEVEIFAQGLDHILRARFGIRGELFANQR
jgi:hypothetical protein